MPLGDTLLRDRANWLSGALDSTVDGVAVGLSSSEFAALPVVEAPRHLPLVLDKDEEFGVPEIVWVTSHALDATTVVVLRAQEGTVGRTQTAGTKWVHGLTAFDMNDMAAVHESDTAAAAQALVDHEAAAELTYLKLDGTNDPMQSSLNMGGFRIGVVGVPNSDDDAMPRSYADLRYLRLDGAVPMTDNLNMGEHRVAHVGDPNSSDDAMPRSYADTRYVMMNEDNLPTVGESANTLPLVIGGSGLIYKQTHDFVSVLGDTMDGELTVKDEVVVDGATTAHVVLRTDDSTHEWRFAIDNLSRMVLQSSPNGTTWTDIETWQLP